MAQKITRTVITTNVVVQAVERDTMEVKELEFVLPYAIDDDKKALREVQKQMYDEYPNYVVLKLLGIHLYHTKYAMPVETFVKNAQIVD